MCATNGGATARSVGNCGYTHHRLDEISLAYQTLVRLREFAENRVWPQRRGLVVNYCYHSILCRRSRGAPTTNQRHYRDSTLHFVLLDLTFQFDSCIDII